MLIFMSFIGAAAFGAVIINHSMASHGGCLASLVTGAPCPMTQANLLLHHMTAIQALFSSLPKADEIALLVLSLFSFGAILFFGRKLRLYPPPKLLPVFNSEEYESAYFKKQSFLFWFNLLERSPSF